MVVKSSKDHCQVVKSYVGRWGGAENKPGTLISGHILLVQVWSTTGNVSNVVRW